MATRHLRKLQAAQQRVAQQQRHSDDESDEDGSGSAAEAVSPPGRAPFNPFDLLDGDSDGGDSGGDSGNEDDEQSEHGSDPPAADPKAAAVRPSQQQSQQRESPQAKKSKKKKKKKGGGGAQAGAAAAASSAGSGEKQQPQQQKVAGAAHKAAGGANKGGGNKGGGGDDIEAILAELDAKFGPSSGGGGGGGDAKGAAAGASLPPLLAVDVRRLRGDDELRRIFGAGVVGAVDREDDAASGRGAAVGGRRYGWAPRNAPRRRPMKRGMLVAPRDDWPYYEPGTLTMEPAGTADDGTPMFRYVWPPAYRAAQALFAAAQASHDPNEVAALLMRCPYHVDALLAMADLYRATGEGAYAEESLNRALYALEAAWPPGFDPASGRCRVDVARPENRALFVALFRHAQALSRRGCHGAALEAAKLLLALDPSDPLGALQLLDYLALRAGRYEWLEQLVERFDGGAALTLLPNYAYALALARFRREQQQQQQAGEGADGAASSSAAPAGSGGGTGDAVRPSALDTLISAMHLHPLAVPRLMQRLQGQGVGRDAYWSALLERRLFKGADDGGSATLDHLVGLFVERSHLLWKAGDVQAWMRRAAEVAACELDGEAPPAAAAPPPRAAGLPPRPGPAEWAAARAEAYPADDADEGGGGRNEFGHLRLADFSDAAAALPRDELAAAMGPGGAGGGGGDGDDAAMLAAIAAQVEEAAAAAAAAAGGGGGARGARPPTMGEEELRGQNPLVMLLRSLLPWVDAGQAPEDGGDGGGGEQEGGGNGAGPPQQQQQ